MVKYILVVKIIVLYGWKSCNNNNWICTQRNIVKCVFYIISCVLY